MRRSTVLSLPLLLVFLEWGLLVYCKTAVVPKWLFSYNTKTISNQQNRTAYKFVQQCLPVHIYASSASVGSRGTQGQKMRHMAAGKL
jgi:hypothetical protein